jgi:hypothetical protein
MKIKQVSVFLENKPGQLLAPCQVLADAGINILTLSMADTQQFGILRLIVRDWNRAKDLLEKAGCVVRLTDVLAVEVDDRPGGLADIVRVIERTGLNIEYMYAFTFGRAGRAVLIFRFEDADAAIDRLQAGGVNVLGTVDFFTHAEKGA